MQSSSQGEHRFWMHSKWLTIFNYTRKKSYVHFGLQSELWKLHFGHCCVIYDINCETGFKWSNVISFITGLTHCVSHEWFDIGLECYVTPLLVFENYDIALCVNSGNRWKKTSLVLTPESILCRWIKISSSSSTLLLFTWCS